jgi:hypothetical protein
MIGLRLIGVAVVVASATLGCGSAVQPASQQAPLALDRPMRFELDAVDGSRITSDGTRGRNTVVGFITTYDLASQAVANFLKNVAHEHVPRTNVFAIVLEQPESWPLARAYGDTLQLRYPLVLMDPRERATGPFKDMTSVPCVLILDREGRPRWRKNGIVDAREIESALRALE